MKRICGNCRAFQRMDFQIHCLLGYPIKAIVIPTKFGPLMRGKPLEECEKPTTNDEFTRLLRERQP